MTGNPMADNVTWLPDLARAEGAKYQAIVDALGTAIDRAKLRGGDRLPPQRALADRLGVDLTTVTKAYDTARQRGLIEARGRAGTFVREPASVPAPDPAQVDMGMNMPPDVPGGMLGRAIAETTAALLATGGMARMHYQPAGGAPLHRAAGARLLTEGGLASTEEQVIVTAGGQNALHAILGATLSPGDAVACGRFVYSGFKALAERLGLCLVPLAEMSADALDKAYRHQPVKALYVVPTNDNPTALTLDPGERRAMADMARRHGVQIIEDDAYGRLAADPIMPIAGFAPERSWHVASMSKLVSPALRVAFVRAPDVASALRLAADVHETAVMAPPLNAALVTAWLEDGTFGRLLAAMRRESAVRQALAAGILADVEYQAHPQGYHLWLALRPGLAAADLVDAMRPTGLSVVAGTRFAVTPDAPQAVRVSLGGLIDRDRLAGALRLFHGHVASPFARMAPLV